MAEKDTMRFNLQFNLNDNDQKLAASLLNGMGRKKTALVTKAILFLFENYADGIHDLKTYDYSKTSDLMFRASLSTGNLPNIEKGPEEKKNKKTFPVKKVKTIEKSEDDEEIKKTSNFVKIKNDDKGQTPVPEDIEKNYNNENNEILEGMLDALDSFM